jgi:hypothetical protein
MFGEGGREAPPFCLLNSLKARVRGAEKKTTSSLH